MITKINGLQNYVDGIQSNISSLSTNIRNIGSSIDVDILGLRPLSSVAQYFYNASTTLTQLSKTTQDAGQTIQQTSATLAQLKTAIILSMPYMFLYIYMLNSMFMINGIMWMLYLNR